MRSLATSRLPASVIAVITLAGCAAAQAQPRERTHRIFLGAALGAGTSTRTMISTVPAGEEHVTVDQGVLSIEATAGYQYRRLVSAGVWTWKTVIPYGMFRDALSAYGVSAGYAPSQDRLWVEVAYGWLTLTDHDDQADPETDRGPLLRGSVSYAMGNGPYGRVTIGPSCSYGWLDGDGDGEFVQAATFEINLRGVLTLR